MAHQVASAREGLLAEFDYAVQMADDGVADLSRLGREIRLVKSAFQESACGQNDIAGGCVKGESEKGEQQGVATRLHTSPRSHAPVCPRDSGEEFHGTDCGI
jgi:hypothetical protein